MGHPVPPSENPGLAFGGRQRAQILTKTHEAVGGKDEEPCVCRFTGYMCVCVYHHTMNTLQIAND